MKLSAYHLQQLGSLINYVAFATLLIKTTISTSLGDDAEHFVDVTGGHPLLVTCTVHEMHYLPVSWVDVGKLKGESEEDIDNKVIEDIPHTLTCIDYDNQHKEYKLTYDGHSDVDILIRSPIFNGIEPTSGETILQVPSHSVLWDKSTEDLSGFIMDLSIQSNEIKVMSNSNSSSASSGQRRSSKQKRIGESTVAVFRVNTADSEPTISAVQLADDIFGIGPDQYNLQSGYRLCSGNKLNFYPGEGNGLVNGILEVYLEESTAGVSKNTVENWARAKLASSDINFPFSNYDHYMYVLPPNVDFDTAAAYACLWCPKTVFYDYHARNYQVLLHEIGHNIGHVHSGKDGASYADRTCWMGSHTYWDEGPNACFNSPKSWYMGWYNDRHKQVVPSTESVLLKLAGIDDYLNNQTIDGEHFVILRLKEGSEDLYVMYNRAEGVNRGVRGSADKVTVVEQKGDRRQSWQLGELDAGETFTKSNWNGSGKNLVISVCNLVPGTPDHANLVAYVEGDTSGNCDDFTFAPTSSPTNTPENIHVNYYAVSLNTLPAEGLKSLEPYADGYVQNINFLPGSGENFATSGRANDVAALFEGYWEFPFSDTYYICITSDDGSKLFIENTLVIDNDNPQGSGEKCNTYIGSGVRKMRVEYFQKAGGKKLFLRWVPLSRPPEFRIMVVVDSSAFVRRPNESKTPTVNPSTNSPVSPTSNPSFDPTVSPILNPTVDPITSPSSNPSADLTMSPSTTQRGNVHVNYYEALAWNSLPSSGLSSLSPYKAEMVDNINYPSTEGTFAGSGRTIHVAALFEAYLEFPFPDRYYMCITSDDGSKLFLDNMLVIDNDETHSSTEVCSFYNGTGVTKMEVEYFQRGGGKELFVKWVPMSRPPNFRLMVVIPPSAFVQKPKMTETPSSRPSNFPSILPSKVLHICNDSTTWIQGGKNKKNCAWVRQDASKRCKKIGNDGNKDLMALDACPIACRDETKCSIPYCDENWFLTGKNKKTCKKYLKKAASKPKLLEKRCGKKGELSTDRPSVFAYTTCNACGECKKKKKSEVG